MGELNQATVDRAKAVVSGDEASQNIADAKIMELEGSIKTAQSIAASTDPAKDGMQKVNITEEDYKILTELANKHNQTLASKQAQDDMEANYSKSSGGFDSPTNNDVSSANSTDTNSTDANSNALRFRSRDAGITDSREELPEEPLQRLLRQVVAAKGFG